MEINISNFPIISVVFPEKMDDRSMNLLLTTWKRLYQEQKYFKFIFDTKKLSSVGHSRKSLCFAVRTISFRVTRKIYSAMTYQKKAACRKIRFFSQTTLCLGLLFYTPEQDESQ